MLEYIFYLITIYIFFGFLLFVLQRKIVFNVSGKPKSPLYYNLTTIEEVFCETKDGFKLLSWYSKPKFNNPTLLYLHGNSFDIGERAYRIKKYIDNGWGVLILSWRGYSGNLGYPTEKNLYLDAEAALKLLTFSKKTKFCDIVLYGESLGTAVAVEMAIRYSFRSLVLEAPFTSIYDIAKKKYKIYPFKFLILDKFDNLIKISKINTPLLIISGKKDEVIPHRQSVKLFKKANEPKESVFIDEAMHNNLYDFGISKKVIEFNNKYINK